LNRFSRRAKSKSAKKTSKVFNKSTSHKNEIRLNHAN
jgi:hypothetical protein